MQTMPTQTLYGSIPSISDEKWVSLLQRIIGRQLTPDEEQRANNMARHNWTIRVVATELFGSGIVDNFFKP